MAVEYDGPRFVLNDTSDSNPCGAPYWEVVDAEDDWLPITSFDGDDYEGASLLRDFLNEQARPAIKAADPRDLP